MRRPRIIHPVAGRPTRRVVGFTIVELLTAVAIIIVILSIVIVAVSSAVRSAQRTNTQSLLTAISQGLDQFREGTGYLPPVLDNSRNLRWEFSDGIERFSGPDPGQDSFETYRNQIQEWHSITSLADYLLGYGPVKETSTPGEFWSPDGYPGQGIRNPGPDGYWGVSTLHSCFGGNQEYLGTLDGREFFLDPDEACAATSNRFREGAVLGPYLQLRDERLLGAIDPENPWEDEERGQYRVYFAGEAGYDPDFPKVIVDYWGQPIRYFRTPYPTGQPGAAFRRVQGHPTFGDPAWSPPSLSHVIAVRPFLVAEGDDTDAPPMGRTGQGAIERFADANDDTTTSRSLQSATFALLSAGPNRSVNAEARVDDDELNRGNLLEIGR